MVRLLADDIQSKEVLDWQGVHLIHFHSSTCSQKTRIFLNLKGIDWHSHHLDLAKQANYEPWFLGINPRGLVPVLVHDGVVHIESNDILSYLEQTFPQPSLLPPDQIQDIQAGLQEEDNLHLDIRTLTMRFLAPRRMAQKKPDLLKQYAQNSGTIEGQPDSHKAVELKFWRDYARQGITDAQVSQAFRHFHEVYIRWEARLSDSAYLCGEQLTLLDVAWFIYTHRLLAAGYPFARLHPNVEAWYRRLLAQPAFAKEVKAPMAMRIGMQAMQFSQRMRGATLAATVGC